LQARYTFAELDRFLSACGIDVSQHEWGNSKRVYARDILSAEPEMDSANPIGANRRLALRSAAARRSFRSNGARTRLASSESTKRSRGETGRRTKLRKRLNGY
jgi:hypothetical protein